MKKTTGTTTHLPTRFYITEVICRYCDTAGNVKHTEFDMTEALVAHGWLTLIEADGQYVDICPDCATKEGL